MNKLEQIQSKIYSEFSDELDRRLNFYRFKNQKIVFTNGCFDLVHLGHLEYLTKAADLGDVLIIGMNSDDSVKRLKGNNRPIFKQDARAKILAGFSFVSMVIIFNEDTPYNLIHRVNPNVLVKGKDYSIEHIVGADIVKKNGGEVITIDLVEGYSTTKLIEKLK